MSTLTQEKEHSTQYHFDVLYELESKSFWFVARNRLIKHLFQQYLQGIDKPKILEIGCGTGFVLQELSKNKNYILQGSELRLEGLKFAKSRLPDVEFFQLDAKNIPFQDTYDVIGAFDTLEHIEEDELVIKNVYKALKQNGLFFITVPQHRWLWSNVDETSDHKRRYSKKELISKLNKANFSTEFVSSFVFSLLPLMILSRFRMHKKIADKKISHNHEELRINPVINSILDFVLGIEESLIRLGIRLPVGGSLVIVAKKRI